MAERTVTTIVPFGARAASVADDVRRVLEVKQWWDGHLNDTAHFELDHGDITVGSIVGHRWRFVGVDMGWVGPRIARFLPYFPPLCSEIATERRNDFSPAGGLASDRDEIVLVAWKDDRYVARIEAGWTVTVDGEPLDLDDAVASGRAVRSIDGFELPIDDRARVRVAVAGSAFDLRWTHRPLTGLLQRVDVDLLFVAVLAVALVVGLAFFLVIALTPKPPDLEREVREEVDYVVIIPAEPKPEPPPPPPAEKPKPKPKPKAKEPPPPPKEEPKTVDFKDTTDEPPPPTPRKRAPVRLVRGLTLHAKVGTSTVTAPLGNTMTGAPTHALWESNELPGLTPEAYTAVNTRPKVKYPLPPLEIPDSVKDAEVQGTVQMLLTVDPLGRVARVQIIAALHPDADRACVEQARKTRWRPGTSEGGSVSVENVPYSCTIKAID